MLQNFDLSKMFQVEKISDKQSRIVSDAKFFDGSPLELILLEEGGEMVLSDNKSTLKYMNKLYELTAPDVKKCISLIMKAFNFKMRGGEIIASVPTAAKLPETILSLMQCCTQMSNMFIFFDKPEN